MIHLLPTEPKRFKGPPSDRVRVLHLKEKSEFCGLSRRVLNFTPSPVIWLQEATGVKDEQRGRPAPPYDLGDPETR